MNKANTVKKNILISILAQLISMLTSFILGFIVPKCIDEYQYAYWQIFVLYIGYASIFNFGILDGLMLRYSQYNYEDLNKEKVRSQFQSMLVVNLALCIIACSISNLIESDIYKWLVILLSVGMLFRNIFTYTSYTFQMTNRIKYYATIVIAQRASYAAVVVMFLLLKINDFRWYCLADILGDVAGCLICSRKNKGLYCGSRLKSRENFLELKDNISSGILLLISNLSSGLLTGGAKMVTQWRWDELTFGKVSFAFSLFSVFFSFVIAISVVLFPTLKRLSAEELPHIYKKIRDGVSPILFAALFFYFPGCFVLGMWLPQYKISLVYLGLLLPLVIYTSKISLLTNNYLKVYRKEKIMLVINLVSVGATFALCLFCAYILNNLDLLLCSVVLVCVCRSVVSELIVARIIKISLIRDFVMEIILTVVFIVAARYLTWTAGAIVYLLLLLICLFSKYVVSYARKK